MFSWLINLFSDHDWEYTPAVYPDSTCWKLGMPLQDEMRVCRKCGRTEYKHVHCLGLNPPTYVSHWYTHPDPVTAIANHLIEEVGHDT